MLSKGVHMKKIIILIFLASFICGCTNVKNLTYDDTLRTISSNSGKQNVYRTGYKYFLPRGIEVIDSKTFNEVLSNDKYKFYLYVDALSFHNNIKNTYKVNSNCYYSKIISYKDKFGYLEINLTEKEKYLIEIMYNYAKIEVIVEKEDINKNLLSAISILKSIEYKDSIVANMFGDDVLHFVEEEFNIFNTTSNDSTYIQIDNTYQEKEETVPDTDLIK